MALLDATVAVVALGVVYLWLLKATIDLFSLSLLWSCRLLLITFYQLVVHKCSYMGLLKAIVEFLWSWMGGFALSFLCPIQPEC